MRPRALIGLPLSLRWYHCLQSSLCLFSRKLNFFLIFFFLQELSGDNDVVDTVHE